MIDRARCSNGLYLLAVPDKSLHTSSSYACRVTCSVDIDTWHSRLGHLSHQRLNSMKNVLQLNSTT